MKSLTEYLWMNTPTRYAFVNITPPVEELVRKSGIKDGLLLCKVVDMTVGVVGGDVKVGDKVLG